MTVPRRVLPAVVAAGVLAGLWLAERLFTLVSGG